MIYWGENKITLFDEKMKKKIRYSIVIITLFVLEVLSLTSSKQIPFLSAAQTPKPKIKPIVIPIESHACHSDGI